MPKGLPFELKDYLELIQLTDRCICVDKTGYIDAIQTSLLTRLNIGSKNWLTLSKGLRKLFHGAVGHETALTYYCQYHKLKR